MQVDRMAKQQRKKKTSKANTRANRVFWTSLILFLLPFLVLGWILVSAAMDTGSPILGERYKNDLDPAIVKADLERVKSESKGVNGVEKVDLSLATATLRVYADIGDLATVDDAKKTAGEIYTAVTHVLDPNVYFSQVNGEKMYDLEIHVYNRDKDMDQPGWVYVIETKNSGMDKPLTQVVSQPVDPELAEQLRQDVEDRKNPKPKSTTSGEINLGGNDVQEQPKENQKN